MSAAVVNPPVTVSAPEAEAALLGALLLLDPRTARTMCVDLRDEDFVDPRHRRVLRAVSSILDQGVTPDPVTVLGELRRTGDLSPSTGRSAGPFLADLLSSVPVPLSAGYYARIVKEHAARRRLVEAGVRLQQAAEGSPLDALDEVLETEAIAGFHALRRAGVVQ